MGEAKRRRLLDANYGKAKMPDCLADKKTQFLDKQTDLEIMTFFDCRSFIPGERTQHSLVFTSHPKHNNARHAFVEHQQQVMPALTPLIQTHPKGWITQHYDCRTDSTQWGYVRANSLAFTHLQTEVFSGLIGRIISDAMRVALESWSFEESNILIPVIAMSNYHEDSSWLYCI
ncbi:MAG: hypothetical protein KME32_28605 [Mojavia pulchra JT2-VF2]|jgi:hypothetical protein|uniref:Uncharacterized protein n=1 Tax=Mojavia pulchra JT2-VF2 TaxID=287848 RepID=A0A951Q464_9NOST|nr:hypothetical protein [Mojavia pulchra JT2-VF2]